MPKYQEVVEVGKFPELAGGKGEITRFSKGPGRLCESQGVIIRKL